MRLMTGNGLFIVCRVDAHSSSPVEAGKQPDSNSPASQSKLADGGSSQTPLDSGGRIPELDGLRGVAILAVLVSHYVYSQASGAISGPIRFLGPALGMTWSGVELFFVLSGFLIGGILLDHRDSPRFFGTFYLRRFWRIIPIYALVCAAFWCVGSWLDLVKLPRPYWLFHAALPWYAYATMTQNIWMALAGGYFGANWLGVTWSLAIEEQFYLCAPLLIKWLPPKRLPGFLCYAVLAGWILRQLCGSVLLFVFPSEPLSGYVLMPCHLDGLAAGMLAAWAFRDPKAAGWLRTHRGFLSGAMALGFVVLCVFAFMGWGLFSRPMSLAGYSVLAVFFTSVLMHTVLFPDSLLAAALRWRWLRRLGIVSYCVYLIHQPVAGLCHWLLLDGEPALGNWRQGAVTLLALVITLLLAGISWRYLEKPLLRRGHRRRYDP